MTRSGVREVPRTGGPTPNAAPGRGPYPAASSSPEASPTATPAGPVPPATSVTSGRPAPSGTWARMTARRDACLPSFARRTGRWAPWLALPLLWWLLRWLTEDLSVFRALYFWGISAVVGWTWSVHGQARLEVRSRWLHLRGRFVDQRIAWRRVGSVTADDDALVVRLDPGTVAEDALLLGNGTGAPPLTRASADPRTVAAELDRARVDGGLAEPPGLARLPSVPALVGAAWLAVAGAATLVSR